ncbi:MAG TPA: glycosyltransferase, partial [Candidatus Paceibacterota bacterium]|nr:glycosyltransferase [Candidatus Paceibacterota bacterium]
AARIGWSVIQNAKLAPNDSVITTQDPFETGSVGAKLARRSGIPLHVQLHTDIGTPFFKRNFLNRIRLVMAKRVFKGAKAIRTVSERTRSSLPADVRAKTSVLPVFIDLDEVKKASVVADLRAKYPEFKKIALMASRITAEKDMGTALRAFAAALRKIPDAGLVIGGAGPKLDELKALASRLGIAERVMFEPWADHDTLTSYMKTCDAFVLSSLFEGYGMALLEAHASGATIVSTDVGIAPLLADSRAIVPPRSPEALAEAVVLALSGEAHNKPYQYPYPSKAAYLAAHAKDIERALL